MELVVDTNILVAGALRARVTRELILNDRFTLWGPEHLMVESKRNLGNLLLLPRLSDLSKTEVMEAFDEMTSRIRLVPTSSFRATIAEALRLAPHPEDASFLALAMHLCLPLWSNDAGFKKQNAVTVYATHELLKLFNAQA